MTLNRRARRIITLVLATLFVVVLVGTRLIVMSGVRRLERRMAQTSLQLVTRALADRVDDLSVLARDWAVRSEVTAYAAAPAASLRRTGLDAETLKGLGLDALAIVDAQGRVLYGQGYDPTNSQPTPLPAGLAALKPGDPVLQPTVDLAPAQGLVVFPEGVMLVASQPVTAPGGTGARCALILVRRFDPAEAGLTSDSRLTVTAHPYDASALPAGFADARAAFARTGSTEMVSLAGRNIAGYAIVTGLGRQPALILEVAQPHDALGVAGMGWYAAIWAAICVTLWALAANLIRRTIVTPVSRLYGAVKDLAASASLSSRLAISGGDEVAGLSRSLSLMLDAIKKAEHYQDVADRLKSAHQQVLNIIDSLPDATFVLDQCGCVIAWNRAIEQLTGTFAEDIIGRDRTACSRALYSGERPILTDLLAADEGTLNTYYERAERRGEALYAETTLPRAIGLTLSVTASPLYDGSGRSIGAIESIRDISDRRQAEDQIEFLSTRDPMTGLYNRTYFERQLRRLENDQVARVAIILGDVDGLKLYNDVVGHLSGDRLLLAASDAIKTAFRHGGIAARVGGDEFAILLSGKVADDLETVCRSVEQAVAEYNESNPDLPLSLSLGRAVRDSIVPGLNELFNEADADMYREKLNRSQSARSAIVRSLMRALEARDYITEWHAQRLQTLISKTAAAAGLTTHNENDLRLLAQFHDIGKVGVPDRVLLKEGPLAGSEVAEMRQHCEIGFHIAQSVPELAPISDWILKHHERWDGKGYPLGLKGRDIPVECRLMAIVDAYDAMTSDRPYRKAMEHKEAIAELTRFAGSQFDPGLVPRFVNAVEEIRAAGALG